MDRDNEAICPKCVAKTLADFRLRGLVTAWCADADAMPTEDREALLDAVRERVVEWIAGYPEMRESKVHVWFVKKLQYSQLGASADEMSRLCEEAGYPR